MLHPPLTPVEQRVLGALLEKERTTPDTYPLTLAALVAACNQTTNRDPVMALSDDAVTDAVVALRRRGLVRQMQPAGSRVAKFSHLLADVLALDARALALLGVLLLRGAQTPGELRTRAERLAAFDDLAEVEATLDALAAREPALVARLARRPGQKEVRYVQLLGGAPAADAGSVPNALRDAGAADPGGEAASADVDDAAAARMHALERTIDALRAELAALRAEFEAFRGQFG